MIPISVSDVLKLLDEIPIWKAVRALPKRITELEARLKALEDAAGQKPIAQTPTALVCPICESRMKVKSESPHPEFAFAGVKVHTVECPSCGHKSHRDFDPGKGYS